MSNNMRTPEAMRREYIEQHPCASSCKADFCRVFHSMNCKKKKNLFNFE